MDWIAHELSFIGLGETAAEQILVEVQRKCEARAHAKIPSDIDQTTDVRIPCQERGTASLMKDESGTGPMLSPHLDCGLLRRARKVAAVKIIRVSNCSIPTSKGAEPFQARFLERTKPASIPHCSETQ